MRRTEGAPDRVIDEGGARRRDFTHDVVRGPDHQCRNAAGFNDVSDETDGLVAERSIRNEQGEIDFGLFEFSGNGGREFIFNFCRIAQAAHE